MNSQQSAQGPLRILGRRNSLNVMKALWCCEELGLPCEQEDVGGSHGGTQTPQYLAWNPNGRIPTLVQGDFVLWESNVIVRYLCATQRSTLFPEAAQERWRAEQWMDWQQTTLNPSLSVVFWGLVRTPPAQQDQQEIERGRAESAVLWQRLDAHLAKYHYVAGDRFTMGDLPLGCSVYRWYNLPISRPETPSLHAWYKRLGERTPYRKHVMLPLT